MASQLSLLEVNSALSPLTDAGDSNENDLDYYYLRDIYAIYATPFDTPYVTSKPQSPPPSCTGDELYTYVKEQRKIVDTFQSQPWPMRMKLNAYRNYNKIITQQVHLLNWINSFVDSFKQVSRKMRQKVTFFNDKLTFWDTLIKIIEAHCGTPITSYFLFTRWLLAVNILLAISVLLFIVLPQMAVGHGLPIPKSTRENGTALSYILDGKGYLLEHSILFYGYYDSGKNEAYVPPPPNPKPYIGNNYKLPLAFLVVNIYIFIVFALATLIKMGKKYKILEHTLAGQRFPNTWKVFASWDFAHTESKVAQNKKKQIALLIKEMLEETKHVHETKKSPYSKLIRVCTNSLILLILAISGFAIHLAVENAADSSGRNFVSNFNRGPHSFALFLATFLVPIVSIARNFLLPYLFKLAAIFEKHSPRTALRLQLTRMFLLYFSTLYILIISLFSVSGNCNADKEEEDGLVCCWENVIGQELFKLTVLRLLVDVFTNVVDGVRWAANHNLQLTEHKFTAWIKPGEFELAENTLKLMYGQALLMMGVLFCPLLPLISVIKLIILFYSRAIAAYYFNAPPRTVFHIASTMNFYLSLMIATLFLSFFPMGYALSQIEPSNTCGPFRGLCNMLQIVPNEIKMWPGTVYSAIKYLTAATIVIPLFAILGLVIYYYVALSKALKEVNRSFQLQFKLEHTVLRERLCLAKKKVSTKTLKSAPSIQSSLPPSNVYKHRGKAQSSSSSPSYNEPDEMRLEPHQVEPLEYLEPEEIVAITRSKKTPSSAPSSSYHEMEEMSSNSHHERTALQSYDEVEEWIAPLVHQEPEETVAITRSKKTPSSPPSSSYHEMEEMSSDSHHERASLQSYDEVEEWIAPLDYLEPEEIVAITRSKKTPSSHPSSSYHEMEEMSSDSHHERASSQSYDEVEEWIARPSSEIYDTPEGWETR